MLALGKILGGINVLDTFGGAMGPIVTGALVDANKGYFEAFVVITVLLFVASLAAALLDMSKGHYHTFDKQAA